MILNIKYIYCIFHLNLFCIIGWKHFYYIKHNIKFDFYIVLYFYYLILVHIFPSMRM